MIERDSKGRIKPGSGGRPKGSKNKIPADLKQRNAELLKQLQEELFNNFKNLSPKEKAELYAKLLPFELPRLSNIESESTVSFLDFLDLPFEEQKKLIIEHRKRKAEDE